MEWPKTVKNNTRDQVTPRSGRSALIRDRSGLIKCFVKSPAERGLANYEVITLIAKLLGLARADVAIINGQLSRIKRVAITSDLTKKK